MALAPQIDTPAGHADVQAVVQHLTAPRPAVLQELRRSGSTPRRLAIDPDPRTLGVLRLDAGRWTILATHTDNEVVRAEPFAELELELSALWA